MANGCTASLLPQMKLDFEASKTNFILSHITSRQIIHRKNLLLYVLEQIFYIGQAFQKLPILQLLFTASSSSAVTFPSAVTKRGIPIPCLCRTESNMPAFSA